MRSAESSNLSKLLEQQGILFVADALLPDRQLQIPPGVVVADVLNEPSQQRIVLRQFTLHDITPDDVAQDAAEVFVAWVRHERARVGDHADEAREQAGVRESVELRGDALLLVEEPPGAAKLNFAGTVSILKAAGQGCELKVVGGVQVVQDHLRQGVFPGEQIEVGSEMPGLGEIADGVVTSVCSELAAGRGVHVAQGAQVQLFGPGFFSIEAAEEKHHEGRKLDAFIYDDGPGDGFPFARLGEDERGRSLGTWSRVAML